MELKCELCRHYRPAQDWDYVSIPSDRRLKGYGVCEMAVTDSGVAVHNTKALAEDGESYSARLRVSPTFGCMQFVPK